MQHTLSSDSLRNNRLFSNNSDASSVHMLSSGDNVFNPASLCDPYADDIFYNLLEDQKRKVKITLNSSQLGYRASLICLMRKQASRLQMCRSTLHLGVWLLDCYMDVHEIHMEILRDLALVCLNLAAKVEERYNPGSTYKKMFPTDPEDSLSPVQVRSLEGNVATNVKWRFNSPTVVTFALALAKYTVTLEDISSGEFDVPSTRAEALDLLNAYVDLTLMSSRLNVYDTSLVAAACIACVRKDLMLNCWPNSLSTFTGHSAKQLGPIMKALFGLKATVMESLSVVIPVEHQDDGYISMAPTPSPGCSSTTASPKSLAVTPKSYTCLDQPEQDNLPNRTIPSSYDIDKEDKYSSKDDRADIPVVKYSFSSSDFNSGDHTDMHNGSLKRSFEDPDYSLKRKKFKSGYLEV